MHYAYNCMHKIDGRTIGGNFLLFTYLAALYSVISQTPLSIPGIQHWQEVQTLCLHFTLSPTFSVCTFRQLTAFPRFLFFLCIVFHMLCKLSYTFFYSVVAEYGKSLEDDICSDTSFMFQRVLVSMAAVSFPFGWEGSTSEALQSKRCFILIFIFL